MNDAKRQQLNTERLQKIDVSIRNQVENILRSMELYGFKPLIGAEVWRDPKLQAKLKAQGRSKLSWGFHCATTPDGKPASLAADIVDADKAWNATAEFWLALGYCARKQGLGWGGLWGLPASLKTALIAETGKKPSEQADTWKAFGWDVAHVEVSGITVAEARAGKRPATPRGKR